MADTKIAELEAACRDHGLPVTVQRRTILEVLAERDDHPTADQVWESVKERLPDVSRTTVYRVLDTLVKLRLAVKAPHSGGTVRFDPRTERHHHLVCIECDKVIDLESRALDGVRLPDTRRLGFEADDFSIYVRGVCADCRPSGRTRRRT